MPASFRTSAARSKTSRTENCVRKNRDEYGVIRLHRIVQGIPWVPIERNSSIDTSVALNRYAKDYPALRAKQVLKSKAEGRECFPASK
jgi:hypothetical protein